MNTAQEGSGVQGKMSVENNKIKTGKSYVHSYSGAFGTRLKDVLANGFEEVVVLPRSPLMAMRTLRRTEKRILVSCVRPHGCNLRFSSWRRAEQDVCDIE